MNKISILLFSVLLPFSVFSQAEHYWTQQYGTRSMLLSGSVIGGVEDLGAVYYNPARLGFIENPVFIMSANVYQLTKITSENVLGDNINKSQSEFDGVPSLAAGTFKISFLPNHHFAYAVLSRQRANLGFDYQEEEFGDVISDWDGEEYFEGEIGLKSNVKEDWFGCSWAHAVSEKVSFGASGFLSVNKVDKGSLIQLRALTEDNRVATYNFNRNFSFTAFSLIWKLAAAFKFKNVDVGLTITTPGIKLRGKSNYNYQYYFSGIESNNDAYANSYQSDLEITTKKPLAIGAGGTFSLGNGKIHVSAEYYGNVPQYEVFHAEDHAMQSQPDSIISFRLVDQMNNVINAGIGFEWLFSQKVSAYCSFSTDFSAAVSETSSFLQNKSEINNSTNKSNFYHYGGGVVLSFTGADITLGATYTGSKQNFARPISFPEEGGDSNQIFDPNNTGQLKWTRWNFVVSVSVPFLRKYADEKWDKIRGKDKEE